MDYLGQVGRLADALTFSLQTLPDSVSVKEVQHALSVLFQTCQRSNFVCEDVPVHNDYGFKKNHKEILHENIVINSNVNDDYAFDIIEKEPQNNIIQSSVDTIKVLNSIEESVTIEQIDVLSIAREADKQVETESSAIEVALAQDDGELSSALEIKNQEVDTKLELSKIRRALSLCKFHCVFCEKFFITAEEQLEHDENLHKNGLLYSCLSCDFTDESKIEVMNHFGDTHKTPSSIKYCFDCKQGFYRHMDLRKHLQVVHKREVPMESCLMCHEAFPSYKKATHHMRTIHRYFKVRCPKYLCNQYFDTIDELNIHSKSHIAPDEMKCPHCDKKFSQFSRFQYHVKSHSMEKNVTCPQCDHKFFFEIDLRLHIRRCHELKILCDQCDHKVSSDRDLRVHKAAKHAGEKKYKCNVCDMAFAAIEYLKRHHISHSDDRKHKCNICDKGFKLRKTLTTHSKIHSKEYQGQCNICGKEFVQKSNLKLHMKKHHPE